MKKKKFVYLSWLLISIFFVGCSQQKSSDENIAFIHLDSSGSYGLGIYNYQNDSVKMLYLDEDNISCASWNDEGSELMFAADSGKKLFLYNLNQDSLVEIEWLFPDLLIYHISWLSSANQLALTAGNGHGAVDIYLYSLAENKLLQITDTDFIERDVEWIDGENKLVYSANFSDIRAENKSFDLFIYGLEDDVMEVLIIDEPIYISSSYYDYTKDINPVWGSDSSVVFNRIALVYDEDGMIYEKSDLYKYNYPERELIKLTEAEAREQFESPTRSPNLEKIAFISNFESDNLLETDMFVMNDDGGNIEKILDLDGSIYCLAWQP